ncbi:MAG: PqqD family protein [Phycisphaerae bacterium]|nr:PqqD family protein [Phycisphaerae bacterium]
MMAAMNDTFRRKDGIVTRHIAGETILVPVANNLADLRRIFVLNPVAEFIWEQLDGALALGAIAQRVAESFDIGPAQAERDCRAFVDELTEADLLVKE